MVELAPALLAGILTANVINVGFQLAVYRVTIQNKTKIEERTEQPT